MLEIFPRDPPVYQVSLVDQEPKDRGVDKDQPDHKAQLESEDQLVDKAVPERMVNLALLDILYDIISSDVL